MYQNEKNNISLLRPKSFLAIIRFTIKIMQRMIMLNMSGIGYRLGMLYYYSGKETQLTEYETVMW